MYYGGTVADVALAAIVMAQWYMAAGRALARARRRPAAAGPDSPASRAGEKPGSLLLEN